jgi:bifunctional isochorismate lyase/aryl carrier protein
MATNRIPQRDAFFTAENIDQVSSQILSAVRSTVGVRDYTFLPAQSALLIVDMQKFFISSDSHAFVPGAPSIIKRITDLAKAFARLERPVIATRHIDETDRFSMMQVWWSDPIKATDSLSELVPDIVDLHSQVIVKSQYDAFYKTDLEQILDSSGVRQLVICGVMTHLCCETAARSAFVRGFEVFVPVDGNATLNSTLHLSSLLSLSHGFAHVTAVRDLIHCLENTSDIAQRDSESQGSACGSAGAGIS